MLQSIRYTVLVILSLTTPFAVAAQTPGVRGGAALAGVVLSSETGDPIPDALVVLSDSTGSEVSRTISGPGGSFRIGPLTADPYVLGVHALGYESSVNRVVMVGEDGLRLEVLLRPGPVPLDPVVVRAAARNRRLDAVGYSRREATGIGRYIPPEEFDRPGVQYVSDVLRSEPSIEFRPYLDGSNRWDVRFRSAFRQEDACRPLIVLDGTRIRSDSSIALDDLVHPANVLAIELYPRGVGQPVQWSGVDAGCGVIVIWTKTYRP